MTARPSTAGPGPAATTDPTAHRLEELTVAEPQDDDEGRDAHAGAPIAEAELAAQEEPALEELAAQEEPAP